MTEDSSTDNGPGTDEGHDKHKSLYHWVYVAGWCILSAIINFRFLWPESHFFSLLVLATLLSLPLIYELTVLGLPSIGTTGRCSRGIRIGPRGIRHGRPHSTYRNANPWMADGGDR
jgi:hypothetical protein